VGEFRKNFQVTLEDAMLNDELKRQAKWAEAIAVGDRAWIEGIERQIRGRQEMSMQQQGDSGVLREEYGPVLEAEKRAMSSFDAWKSV
jgi:hypothetical protein